MPLHREHLWWADAISVAVFTVVGTRVALASSAFVPTAYLGWTIPPLMGLITGFGSGLVHDLLTSQMPGVMQDPNDAIISFMSGGLYVILDKFQIPGAWMIVMVVAIATLVLPQILTGKSRVILKASVHERLPIKY